MRHAGCDQTSRSARAHLAGLSGDREGDACRSISSMEASRVPSRALTSWRPRVGCAGPTRQRRVGRCAHAGAPGPNSMAEVVRSTMMWAKKAARPRRGRRRSAAGRRRGCRRTRHRACTRPRVPHSQALQARPHAILLCAACDACCRRSGRPHSQLAPRGAPELRRTSRRNGTRTIQP